MRLLSVYLSTLVLTVCVCHATGLPDISELFSALWKKVNSGDHEEVDKTESFKERVKRQFTSTNDIGDSSTIPHIAETSVLPEIDGQRGVIDSRYMPTLSNGHIGLTPYSDTIYMNGVYNGRGGMSHRAKIPSLLMGKLYIGTPEDERRWRVNRKYRLDAETGVFMEEIDCDFVFIQHRMYVHQKYNRLFVSDFYAKAKRHSQFIGGTVYINYIATQHSNDFSGFVEQSYRTDKLMSGTIKEAEVSGVDQQGTVSVYWTNPIQEINARSINDPINQTFVMSIDTFKANAQGEFNEALRIIYLEGGAVQLLREHEDAWRYTWQQGKLEVEGSDLVLKKLVHFSQYYLLSNVPAINPYTPRAKSDYLYGVGRQSFGKGSKDKNQQGHIFWDSEVYILPALLPFHPTMAKEILRYRSAHRLVAQKYAEQGGDKGARYPWESAYSGYDVTPAGVCEGCRERQIHVGASIAWAIRQYYSLTRDRDYLTSLEFRGCEVTKGIADYYANKAKYNPEDGRYHINDVMGPDQFHDHENNDAYTNAVVSLAIHYARYMACECNLPEREQIPDEYIQKALYLKLPFDNVKKLHYQSDNYATDQNKMIQQASVVLLGYPLNWNMSLDIQKNDLEYYDEMTDPRGPALTKSFMTVGWKFINDKAKTLSYFRESYQLYVVQPFKIWTELPEPLLPGEESTVNFLPGMGGFLQSIIYGFAGLRIRPEMIEFHNPQPPQGLSVIRLKGFYYLEANLTITIREGPRQVTIEVLDIGSYPLVLVKNNTWGRGPEETLKPGPPITITNPEQGFYIYSTRGTACDHPRDYIYMPWGYSPFINKASTTTYSTSLLFLVCLMFGLYINEDMPIL